MEQFIKEIDVTEIIEEFAGTDLPYLPEMMQRWIRSVERKEELINSILSRKTMNRFI